MVSHKIHVPNHQAVFYQADIWYYNVYIIQLYYVNHWLISKSAHPFRGCKKNRQSTSIDLVLLDKWMMSQNVSNIFKYLQDLTQGFPTKIGWCSHRVCSETQAMLCWWQKTVWTNKAQRPPEVRAAKTLIESRLTPYIWSWVPFRLVLCSHDFRHTKHHEEITKKRHKKVLEPILDPMRLDNLEPSLELILRIGIAPNTPGIFGG